MSQSAAALLPRVLRDAYRRVVVDEFQDLGDGWGRPTPLALMKLD